MQLIQTACHTISAVLWCTLGRFLAKATSQFHVHWAFLLIPETSLYRRVIHSLTLSLDCVHYFLRCPVVDDTIVAIQKFKKDHLYMIFELLSMNLKMYLNAIPAGKEIFGNLFNNLIVMYAWFQILCYSCIVCIIICMCYYVCTVICIVVFYV